MWGQAEKGGRKLEYLEWEAFQKGRKSTNMLTTHARRGREGLMWG